MVYIYLKSHLYFNSAILSWACQLYKIYNCVLPKGKNAFKGNYTIVPKLFYKINFLERLSNFKNSGRNTSFRGIRDIKKVSSEQYVGQTKGIK